MKTGITILKIIFWSCITLLAISIIGLFVGTSFLWWVLIIFLAAFAATVLLTIDITLDVQKEEESEI